MIQDVHDWIYAPQPVNWRAPLNRGLVAWYLATRRGPTGYGSTIWRDFSAFKGNSTLTGGPVWGGPHGRPGGFGSMFFDGSDDQVIGPTNAALSSSPMSVSFWVKIVNAALFDVFLGKTNTGNWSQGWLFHYSSVLNFAIEGYTTNVAVAAASLSPLIWYHVVGTWDGATVQIYVNGVPGTSDTYSSTITASHPLSIGSDGGTMYNLNGWMDSIRIYNRALPATEVIQLGVEERKGCPTLLNRAQMPMAVSTGGAAATVYHHLSLLGAGVA